MTTKQRKPTLIQRVKSLQTSKPKTEVREYGQLLVLGAEHVGKTAVVRQFCIKGCTDDYVPTTDICTFNMSSIFQTEYEEKTSKRKASKKSLEGKPMRRSISKMIRIGQSDGNNNVFHTIAGLKCLKLQLVDTPANITTSMPLQYRAMVSSVNGFLLVCTRTKKESITYVKYILRGLDELNVDEGIPRVVVVTDAEGGISDPTTESVDILFQDFKVTCCEIALKTKEGIDHLSMILSSALNVRDENVITEENLPSDIEFVEEGRRRSSRKAFFSI